jgi:hypothetical protein
MSGNHQHILAFFKRQVAGPWAPSAPLEHRHDFGDGAAGMHGIGILEPWRSLVPMPDASTAMAELNEGGTITCISPLAGRLAFGKRPWSGIWPDLKGL